MDRDELKIQIGRRIKEFRHAKNMSQSELSQLVNIARSSLAHYEAGDRLPDAILLWDIADCLDVPLDALDGRNKITE